MAEELADVSAPSAPVETPADEAPPVPTPVTPGAEQPPDAGRPYRRRFQAFYILLAAAVGAAAAGIVLAAGSVLTGSGPAWASWQPNAGGTTGAKQIAAHVSKEYHLPTGQQLVDVFAKPPSVSPADQQIPIHYLAVRGKNANGDEVIPVNGSDTVQYSLCGLGDNCAIATGKPSVQRGTLVRREILELALYTFRYMSGVKNVIAFMPPTPGASPKYVVFLQRDELQQQLHVPLARTLSPKTPLPSTISRGDQQTIDATTESRVFSFSLSQAQQGDAILVLAPRPA
ncbi:MAG TPA: hypothetical protein VFL60_08740 [Gaiellaceae bacterium]|nr:hypothetical protein [Gaiellaceae bacterium]